MQMLQLRAMENLWKKNVGHNFNGHSWPTLPEFKNALRHTAAPVSESFIYKLFFIIHPSNTRKKILSKGLVLLRIPPIFVSFLFWRIRRWKCHTAWFWRVYRYCYFHPLPGQPISCKPSSTLITKLVK